MPSSSAPSAAPRCVAEITRVGILPAALEILDQLTIQAVEASVYAAGYPEARIHVIYNSLDYDTQKALRQAITPAPPARPSRPGAARRKNSCRSCRLFTSGPGRRSALMKG